MYNGIKPTRLWHLTGRKHFMYMINQRLSLEPENQHPRYDYFRLLAFVFPSIFGLAYSYTLLGPPKDCVGEKKKTEGEVEVSSPPCPPVPCPPIQKPKAAPKCPSCME